MDYEKLHKDTINKLQQMVNSGKITAEIARGICADFEPESDDERIRKWLIRDIKQSLDDNAYNNESFDSAKEALAWLKALKGKIQPKQEWSEEDKYNHNIILSLLNNECVGRADKRIAIEWLKSLRPQPKQEWTKEDEWKFSDILALLRCGENCHYNTPDLFEWLKSLKDRYAWKPSDKQMYALWNVYQGGKEQAELATLYNDLKKLKE